MPEGPLGGPRPGSNSTLELRIKEIPVPTGNNEGVLPDSITSRQSKEIKEDILTRGVFFTDDRVSVDRKTSIERGLGQTDVWTIKVNVSGMRPDMVDDSVNALIDVGYKFESVEFE